MILKRKELEVISACKNSMNMLMGMRLISISARYLKSHFLKILQQDFAGVLKQMGSHAAQFLMTILSLLPKTYRDKEDTINGTSKLSR
jgi:hypothetical protein